MCAVTAPLVRVFLSYSWDSSQHKERVLALAQRLRGDGVDAWLDRFTTLPEYGWERWMEDQIEQATFVLVVATANYAERFMRKAPAGTGLGATWEGAIITQDLYEAGTRNTKFLPIIFSESDVPHVPRPLRSFTRFRVDTDEGYVALYRQITGQPEIVPAALGRVQKLPSGTGTSILRPLPIPEIHVAEEVSPGVGLCLSGGGYRAMVFHTGALWRLNELGYLPKLDRISSVSGGSIAAAVLGLAWKNLVFDSAGIAMSFEEQVVRPILELADRNIDAPAMISAVLGAARIPERIIQAYNTHLFHDATLQDLPDRPHFSINATNVQSGALWTFSKPHMADYRVGRVDKPTVSLAVAVAASAAFAPFISPIDLQLPRGLMRAIPGVDLHDEPYTTNVVLTDGALYDNLGLETVWRRYRTVFVSDAGGRLHGEAQPKHEWAAHVHRLLNLVDNQVRSLRMRQVIEAYKRGERRGAYWGIRTNIADYGLSTALSCPFERTTELAQTPTRLTRMDAGLQERLINWGYAVCDAALRSYVDPGLPAPQAFPYQTRGV